MKFKGNNFVRTTGIAFATFILTFGLTGLTNFARANTTIATLDTVYKYADFASNEYNINSSTFDISNKICNNKSVIQGHYTLDVSKKDEPTTHFNLETNVMGTGHSTAVLSSTSLGYTSGITINCAPSSSGFSNTISLDLTHLPKNYLNFASEYTISLKKKSGSVEDEVAQGSLKFDTDDVFVLPPNRGKLSLPSGTSLQFNLTSSLGKGTAMSQNPSVLSVDPTASSLSDVKLIAHRPGHATISNGLSGSDKRELMVIVRPEFGIPTVDLSTVVSVTSPAFGSSDAQFHDAIEFLFKNGISNGALGIDGKIHYFGGSMLNRGQFAALFYRFSGSPKFVANPSDDFSDTSNHQFRKEIAWLKASGISSGYNGQFYPDENIKRGEVAKIIGRAFAQESDLSKTSAFNTFVDLDPASDLTKYIKFLGSTTIAHGVTDSSGTRFFPNSEISRGQIAQFLKSTFDKFL
ncbi:MAG: S-layer homology domain-containing protein [Candidatus Ancillula sp.]|jgi:hypothetical protein|nr:S-layer homology domain-containing protein [Candidatus Ancillula sp.]